MQPISSLEHEAQQRTPRRRAVWDAKRLQRGTAAFAALAGYSVDVHQDYEGSLSVVLIPARDDESRPSFLLGLAAELIEVHTCRHDELTKLGCFETLEDALRGLAGVLAGGTQNLVH